MTTRIRWNTRPPGNLVLLIVASLVKSVLASDKNAHLSKLGQLHQRATEALNFFR